MHRVACPLLAEKEITAATGVLRSGQAVQGRQLLSSRPSSPDWSPGTA